MPDSGFAVPTLEDVVDRTTADVDSHVPGADAKLRYRPLRALALTEAGASWGLHRFAANIACEIFPDLASEAGVVRWQQMLDLADVVPVKATGSILFSGSVGASVPTGTEARRNDGLIYLVDAPGGVIGGGGTVTLAATAEEEGEDYDSTAGQALTLTSPLSGVDSACEVGAGGFTGGVSEETLSALRGRVLDRLSEPPQGGAVADFVAWTKAACANVREVWVSPNEPLFGEITIRFIVDPATGLPVDAIPSAGQAQAVRDYIRGTASYDPPYHDAVSPAPLIGDRINIATSPHLAAQAVTFEITSLDPDTADVRTAIEEAVDALMLQRAEPGGTIKVSQVIGAIVAAPGEESHELTAIDGAPPADIVIGANSYPVPTRPFTYLP
ncbi:MAG: baseplate J/gp47 family protein [Gemmatimonadales bacterium]|jgi:uncharacterized phage protein gp47/JayE